MQTLVARLLVAIQATANQYLPSNLQWATRLLMEVLEQVASGVEEKLSGYLDAITSPEALKPVLEKLFAKALAQLGDRPFTQHVAGVVTHYLLEYGVQVIYDALQAVEPLIGFGAASASPTPDQSNALAGVSMSLVGCAQIPLLCCVTPVTPATEEDTTLEPTQPEATPDSATTSTTPQSTDH